MSLTEQTCPSLARGVRLQTDRQTREPLLLFPEGAIYLSESAHQIVRRCDGHTEVGAILAALAAEYESDAETLRKDVLDCLEDLYQRKLVVF